MAKKTKQVKRPIETLDERDARTASERRKAAGTPTRKPAADPGTGENVDNDRLPINHATIPDHRDVGPPPEATPREGKTSPAPPLSPAPRGGGQGQAPDADRPRTRLVEATAMGYYDHARRRPGDVFSIREPFTDEDGNEVDDFSSRWMRDAPRGARPNVTTANQAIRQANQDTRALRADTRAGIAASGNLALQDSGEKSPLED